MRSRPDHREAVARRLELLRSEIDADASAPPAEQPWWEAVPVLELAPPASEADTPPPVPVPGRHAARRTPTRGTSDRLAVLVPQTLRGRVGLGPWQLTTLALLVAAGLAVTCWWVLRADPDVAPVESGSAAPLVTMSAAATGGPSAAPTGAGAATTVTVDIAGKVRRPGVIDLPVGSRVADAIRAAGGARPGADLTGLNRARVLVDGEQIVVDAPGAPAAALAPAGGSGAGTGSGTGPATLVNLNAATADELDALPEVGPVTAQAIIDYRTEHGGFASVDELLDIEGIGEKTLEKIAPHVTV